jgi:hypothetical protein
VSAEIKLELLGPIDGAVADGWPHARACRMLELVDERAHRWRARPRETGTLEDRGPGRETGNIIGRFRDQPAVCAWHLTRCRTGLHALARPSQR